MRAGGAGKQRCSRPTPACLPSRPAVQPEVGAGLPPTYLCAALAADAYHRMLFGASSEAVFLHRATGRKWTLGAAPIRLKRKRMGGPGPGQQTFLDVVWHSNEGSEGGQPEPATGTLAAHSSGTHGSSLLPPACSPQPPASPARALPRPQSGRRSLGSRWAMSWCCARRWTTRTRWVVQAAATARGTPKHPPARARQAHATCLLQYLKQRRPA